MQRHYYASNRKKRIPYRLMIASVVICALIVSIYLNWTRIRLMVKGYGLSSQNIILQLDEQQQNEYLALDYAIQISDWNQYDNQQHYYDYDLYQKLNPDFSLQDIIQYIDGFYQQYEVLHNNGYDLTTCRQLMSKLSLTDFETLAKQNASYSQVSPYLHIKGCIIKDIPQYISSQKSPLEAVLSISYPFIDAKNTVHRTYLIQDPSNTLILIKKGFQVNKDYVPDDLVEVTIPNAPDNEENMLRKEANDALQHMYDDALKENLHLALNSGYRSYAKQKEVYDDYFNRYDPITAGGLVAIPGSSEHQLGLSVDLTSQSVIDGTWRFFGDTPEYDWVVKNAYRYGFILRYPPNESSKTGTANEPWHFRYVGQDVAKEIYENQWTLEDYILKYGFGYDLTIQED